MRTIVIGWASVLGLLVQSGAAYATERLLCETEGPNSAKLTIARAPSPGTPPGVELIQATIRSSAHHLNTSTIVRRVRTRASLRYEDVLGSKIFRLTIQNPDSTHLMAEAVMDEGKVYEVRFPQLHCVNEGTALPPAPPCPAGNSNAALLKIARWGSAEQASLALECGANPNAMDTRGCSALQIMTDLSCGYVASATPGHPADPDAPEAPARGTRDTLVLPDLMKVLIEAGARVDSLQPTTKRTPLMNLVLAGSISELDTLLENSANVNAQDIEGRTALMYAAERGDEIQVRTFLPHSPDLGLKDRKQKTAYDLAVAAGYPDMAEELLKPQAKAETVTGQTDGTCSPTMVHIMAGEEVVIRLTAPSNAMFLMTAPDLGIELMAMPGQSVDQKIKPTTRGTFPFTCGVHGGANQTRGSFMVM